MELLLLSNSTNSGGRFLGHAWNAVEEVLCGVTELLFVPYASAHHDGYTTIVREAFAEHGTSVRGLHEFSDKSAAINDAAAVFVGGGNSFRLLAALQRGDLIVPLRRLVASNRPYVGASAGTNMAAPTLKTTNDMPIVQPVDFGALDLIPFQLNCHYLDADPSSMHAGETRELRLREYLEENDTPVLALREGTYLRVVGGSSPGDGVDSTSPAISAHIGGQSVDQTKGPAVLFQRSAEPTEVSGDVSRLFACND